MNVGKSAIMRLRALIPLLLCCFLTLGGCEQLSGKLGLEDPVKKAARQDAEGRAVGGGCRQSGRAIEDCYAIYTWLPMESIYAGWLDMDAYMRENSLETVTPLLPPPQDPRKKRRKPAEPVTEEDSPAEADAAVAPSS